MKNKKNRQFKFFLSLSLVFFVVLASLFVFKIIKNKRELSQKNDLRKEEKSDFYDIQNQKTDNFNGKIQEKNEDELTVKLSGEESGVKIIKKEEVEKIKTWVVGPDFDREKFESAKEKIKVELKKGLENPANNQESINDNFSENQRGKPERIDLANKIKSLMEDPVFKSVVEKNINWDEISLNSDVFIVEKEGDQKKFEIFIPNEDLILNEDLIF